MYPVPRGIEYDDIRLFFDVIQHLKYIACYEFTVGKSVSLGIFFCGLHRFFDNLHANDLFCHGRQHLTDGSRPAEQIEHGHIVDIPDILPHRLI